MKRNRRDFLMEGAALVTAGMAAGKANAALDISKEERSTTTTPESTRKGDMLYRTLGRTGEQVSLLGLGGAHVGTQKDEQESIRLIRTAVDRGINFLDNSWDYNNGQSEIRMGKALQDGYREKVFLMTKFDGRTKESAAKQIDESLRRLQTDHLDLVQLHEVVRLDDADRFFAEGGAVEAVLEAQKAGKTRYIGFTGHKDPFVHLRTLDAAEKHGLKFDAVQMPINVMDATFRSFQRDVLPRLVKEKIGVLAMKTFGDRGVLDHVIDKGISTPAELIHYSMTLPVSVVIVGLDRMSYLEEALGAVKTFKPLSAERVDELHRKTRVAAEGGKTERFKTTDQFDATAHNPHWLG